MNQTFGDFVRLMRGQVFEINGMTFFTMGGAVLPGAGMVYQSGWAVRLVEAGAPAKNC